MELSFNIVFTSTTWTHQVAASILTRVYPQVHNTHTRNDQFSTRIKSLPEVLGVKGYKTAGFSTMGNIACDFGFSVGFDEYFDIFWDEKILSGRRKLKAVEEGLFDVEDDIALPIAEDINNFLLPWITKNKEDDLFGFIWSIETHVPYTAPETFRKFTTFPLKPGEGEREDIQQATEADKSRLIDLYDDVINYNDHCIGELVRDLKQSGLYDETLLIIASDHGEAFYEHGVYAHGHMPYEELLHVPLIIKFPNQQYKGSRQQELCMLIDIFPTILGITKLDDSDVKYLQGGDLGAVLGDDPVSLHKYVFSDTQMVDVHNRYVSARDKRWKYNHVRPPQRGQKTLSRSLKYIWERKIFWNLLRNPRHFLRNYFHNEREFLFDLLSDPDEKNNLVGVRPAELARLSEALNSWESENRGLSLDMDDEVTQNEESDILRQHLEKLGYL